MATQSYIFQTGAGLHAASIHQLMVHVDDTDGMLYIMSHRGEVVLSWELSCEFHDLF